MSDVAINYDDVMQAVLREAGVSSRVWQSQRLLDRLEDENAPIFVDEVLRDRTNRSLEHVFTILSLVMPGGPLKIAFRGLHTDDVALRGTALEYLESALPPLIRERLWPQLEGPSGKEKPVTRSREDVLKDLLSSQPSIEFNLAAMRKKLEARPPGQDKQDPTPP
jgi:hypothetical protein